MSQSTIPPTIHLACYFRPEHHVGRVLSISNSQPKGMDHPKFAAFIPEWADVRALKAGEMDTETFIRNYWSMLHEVWREKERDITDSLRAGYTCCCWEKPGQFCHRRVLGAFLVRQGWTVILDGETIGREFRILGER